MTRRFDDDLQSAIEELLKQEDSPQERARLLIMLQLVRAVSDVTAASSELARQVKDQRDEFERHVEEQIQVIAQVTGARRALMWVLPAIVAAAQAALGYYVLDQRARIEEMSMMVRETRDRTVENRARLDSILPKGAAP